jgi:hypothetical protein
MGLGAGQVNPIAVRLNAIPVWSCGPNPAKTDSGTSCTKTNQMRQTILDRSVAKGLRMTAPRRVIAQVLEDSADHPDVEELYARANAIDTNISIATVYRTVKLSKRPVFWTSWNLATGVPVTRTQSANITTT